MKWMMAGLVWGMCWSCFSAEDYRIFTDKEDRAVEAKVVHFDARSGKVTLESRKHRKSTVSISIFSEEDQVYIKEWLSVRNFLSSSKLRISVVKKKEKATDSKSQTRRPKPPCHYEIRLLPSSGTTFDAIQIEYCIYVNKDRSKGDDTLSVISEQIDNIQLVAQKMRIERTKAVKLFRDYEAKIETNYSIYSGTTTSTSYNKISEDDLKGVCVRVYLTTPSGKILMREICEPSSIAKRYEWKGPSGKSGDR